MPGQNEWFDQLYREHSARLFKQAYYVLHDSHLAEDLVEETFLILLYKQQTSLDKGTQRKTTENELPSLTQCTA